MKGKSSPPDVSIAPVNRESRFVLLPLTAPPLMADVKVKDVVIEMASACGVELSPAVTNAYKHLYTANYCVY